MNQPTKKRGRTTLTTTEAPQQPEALQQPSVIRLQATIASLLEPHEKVWFHPGKPREVARITPWLQAQIDAGLMEAV